MGKTTWVSSDTYDVTTDDGKTTYRYKVDNTPFHPDTCIEIAEHYGNKTVAYEPDGSIIGTLCHGGKGARK